MKIFLSPPDIGKNEYRYVKEALDSNYVAPIGEFIEKFEEAIKKYVNIKSALALINGTSAIHLALRVLGIEKNGKVLISTFTFIGSVAPILYQNAEPVFIDCDDSWQIDPNLVEDAAKKEKPKALVVAHIYGQMAKIEDLVYLSKKYGFYLIEDAAESLGATYDGRHSGTFGDFGVYSFNGNKIITSGGGGALVSNNENWIKKAKFLATQAKEDFPWYEHKEYGYNYRMSNILAAIGLAQIEEIEKKIKRRREIFEIYKSELKDIADFIPEIEKSKGNRWLTALIFKDIEPLKIYNLLKSKGIESRPLWKPMHMQPLFKNSIVYNKGVSENYFKKGLCLPSGSNLKDEEIYEICRYIKQFC